MKEASVGSALRITELADASPITARLGSGSLSEKLSQMEKTYRLLRQPIRPFLWEKSELSWEEGAKSPRWWIAQTDTVLKKCDSTFLPKKDTCMNHYDDSLSGGSSVNMCRFWSSQT